MPFGVWVRPTMPAVIALIRATFGGAPNLDPPSSPAPNDLMQARRIITADHPYRPLFVEPRHDRCAELGAHVFIVGRLRCLCGELEAFAPTPALDQSSQHR